MKDYGYSREEAVIKSVEKQLERDFFYTVQVGCDFGGSFQSFGGYMLGKHQKGDIEAGKRMQNAWIHELCATFGVETVDDLVGQKCFVLRDFNLHGEFIRGLESEETGRRFLAREFIKKYFPGIEVSDPLEQRLKDMKRDIDRMKKRIQEIRSSMETVASKYVDWTREEVQ